jgi:hypothetical protein
LLLNGENQPLQRRWAQFLRSYRVRPAICVASESLALHAYDAKALPARGAHHNPTLNPSVDRSAEPFQACNLGRDIIGLDVEMNSTFVVNALNLNADLVRPVLEHHVIAASAGMIRVDWAAERFGPETRGGADVVDVAVDQNAVDARAMRHGNHSHSIVPGGFEV